MKIEEKIISIIREELEKPLEYQSSYNNAIYYYREKGWYLFQDRVVPDEVINNMRLVDAGIVKHQGIKMIKYTL